MGHLNELPQSFGEVAKRVVETTRQKMLNSTSKRAHVWATAPRPPEGNE